MLQEVDCGQHSGDDALFHPRSCCIRGAMQRPWTSIPAMHRHGVSRRCDHIDLCNAWVDSITWSHWWVVSATRDRTRQRRVAKMRSGRCSRHAHRPPQLSLWPSGAQTVAQNQRRTSVGGVDAVDQLFAVDPDLGEARGEARGAGAALGAQIAGHGPAQEALRADRDAAHLHTVRAGVRVQG